MRYLLIACAAVLVCGVIAYKRMTKIPVEVYYESLDPYSVHFFETQLWPVWSKLYNVISLKLVPYGRATRVKTNGKWRFTCPHGEDECYVNKIHACLEFMENRAMFELTQMTYIRCLIGAIHPDRSPDDVLDLCLEHKKSKLNKCAKGKQGDTLLARNGELTDLIMKPVPYVPLIVINKKYDESYQFEAVTDLFLLLCRAAVIRPSGCPLELPGYCKNYTM